jgi:hypothetical protein
MSNIDRTSSETGNDLEDDPFGDGSRTKRLEGNDLEIMVGDGFYLKENEQWKVKPIVLVFTGIFISVT